jgi:periplasmic protein TonB
MAFRALLFSKSPDTGTALAAVCKSTEIRVEVCSDIFAAIEKGKTQAYSCVIADWNDQPESSFLLKRARESTPNREAVAIAIVDREPPAAEVTENRLSFLVYRPISPEDAQAVLAKACEQMQPASAEDLARAAAADAASGQGASSGATASDHSQPQTGESLEAEAGTETSSAEGAEQDEQPAWSNRPAIDFRRVCAAALVLVLVFCLWRSRDAVAYLSQTRENRVQVLREAFAAFFYKDQSGAHLASAGSDAQQDAYFSRASASSGGPAPSLDVVATEATLDESRLPSRPPLDFPLPVPTLAPQETPPPMHVQRAAIPESMRNSPPIAPPVVVTVSPAQMMPVSASQSQLATPTGNEQISEPISVSEDAERALLVHTVNPVYPPEAAAQKLHGAVVLQARVGRDGNVEDLKIVRGYFVLGKAAIAAVKQWHFQPYTLNGHAAATQTQITINFTYPPG